MKENTNAPIYTLTGTVIHGRGIGKHVGTPTANMEIGQSYQIQSVFDGMIVWYTPQGGKDTQVFCAGQIGIKAWGLDQTANTGQ